MKPKLLKYLFQLQALVSSSDCESHRIESLVFFVGVISKRSPQDEWSPKVLDVDCIKLVSRSLGVRFSFCKWIPLATSTGRQSTSGSRANMEQIPWSHQRRSQVCVSNRRHSETFMDNETMNKPNMDLPFFSSSFSQFHFCQRSTCSSSKTTELYLCFQKSHQKWSWCQWYRLFENCSVPGPAPNFPIVTRNAGQKSWSKHVQTKPTIDGCKFQFYLKFPNTNLWFAVMKNTSCKHTTCHIPS